MKSFILAISGMKNSKKHKDDIIETSKEMGRLFTRAYRFLKAAKDIYDDWKAANSEGLNSGLANQKEAEALIDKILHKLTISPKAGKNDTYLQVPYLQTVS